MELEGIYTVTVTPFDEQGRVDTDSIDSLGRFLAGQGVQGVLVLGAMGEVTRLTEAERAQVIRAFRQAAPQLQLVAGIHALATEPAVAAARQAEELGADAVMVPPLPVDDDAQVRYYSRVASAVGVPVIIHDYPAETGVRLPAPLVARIHRECPGVRYIKVEDPPTGPKMARIAQLTQGQMGLFGAYGGMYAFEELDRGARGIMTGFAFPDLLVELYRRVRAQDRMGAARLFYDLVPLIRFEFQPGLGVALRKEVLRRRGIIRTAVVREPGRSADEVTWQQFCLIVRVLREKGMPLPQLDG